MGKYVSRFKNITKVSARKFAEMAQSTLGKTMLLAIFMMLLMPTTVYAQALLDVALPPLRTMTALIGAGMGIWGVVNLIEGYGNDNPGAKSQGIKQLMAGIGMVFLAAALPTVLEVGFGMGD